MSKLQGTVIATAQNTQKPDHHNVWLLLPTTVEHAADTLENTKLACLNLYPTNTQSTVWRCVALIGIIDITQQRRTTNLIANSALTVLHELSRDKKLRQALRITAWLVGNDLNAIFHQNRLSLHTSAEYTRYNQGIWLANCMCNGALGNRRALHLNTKTEQVMWTLAKIADRAFCVTHSNSRDNNYPNWWHRLIQNASNAFGNECCSVEDDMLITLQQIHMGCKTPKDTTLGNQPTRAKLWRLIAETAIKTLAYI